MVKKPGEKVVAALKSRGPAQKMTEKTLVTWLDGGVAAVELKLNEALKTLLNPDRPASEQAMVYGAIRDMGDSWDKVTKIIDAAKTRLEKELLPGAFEAENLKSFTTKDGYRVTVSTRFFASIKQGLRDEAWDWLRANGLEDLITETVNASTLSATGKKLLEEGKELSEELFETAYMPAVSLTRTKKD